jgi:predicted amino acid racemase
MKKNNNKELQAARFLSELQKENINIENLRTALRCFFEIDKKEKPTTKDYYTLLRLKMIVEKTGFDTKHAK